MARSRLLRILSSCGALEQLARLVISDRRRLAFAALGFRALNAFHRIMDDGILIAEIFKQMPATRADAGTCCRRDRAAPARRARR
jgi:hypothetical protein